jgi:hypothetical protein
MFIVEKYEVLLHYMHPILQSIPRKHGVAKGMALEELLAVPPAMIIAGKPTT